MTKPGAKGVSLIVSGAPHGERMQNALDVLEVVDSCGKNPNVIIELWIPLKDNRSETVCTETEWAQKSVEAARDVLCSELE